MVLLLLYNQRSGAIATYGRQQNKLTFKKDHLLRVASEFRDATSLGTVAATAQNAATQAFRAEDKNAGFQRKEHAITAA